MEGLILLGVATGWLVARILLLPVGLILIYFATHRTRPRSPHEELQQIVVFIRPWDMPFMMQTARSLRAKGVGDKKPIVYITLWKMAESWLSQQCDHFEEVMFLGSYRRATHHDRYRRVQGTGIFLVCQGGIPFKIMLSAERFKPTESNLQMDFLWRHCKVYEPMIGQEPLLGRLLTTLFTG